MYALEKRFYFADVVSRGDEGMGGGGGGGGAEYIFILLFQIELGIELIWMFEFLPLLQ